MVNRTIARLPASRVRWYHERMTEEYMRVHEKGRAPLQRRLVILVVAGLWKRLYDEAVEAEFMATGVNMREPEATFGDWDGAP